MKALLHTFILLFAFTVAQAQTADDRAKAYYQEALKAFDDKDYQQTIDYCNQVTGLLKSTNARIELLRIKSYYELGEYQNVKASIKTFTNLDASAELNNEALEYLVKVEKIEKAAEERRLAEKRRLEQERLIREQKLAEERRLKEEAEAKSYANAMSGDISAIRRFLKDYPNHSGKQSVLNLLDSQEERAYNNALVKDEVGLYEDYLKVFYDGKHKSLITDELNKAKERNAYRQVLRANSVAECESYLNNYPNGTNKAEVFAVYEQALHTEGEQAMLAKDYRKADVLYTNYKTMFPYGSHIKMIQTKHNEAQRRIKRENVLARREDKGYFMVNYTTNATGGIELGNLKKSYKLSYYGGMHYGNVGVEDYGIIPEDYEGEETLKEKALIYNFGLTMKITYPLWVYAGGGLALFLEGDHIDTEVRGFPEFGLKTLVGKTVVLKGGAQILKNTNVYQFGLGIGF